MTGRAWRWLTGSIRGRMAALAALWLTLALAGAYVGLSLTLGSFVAQRFDAELAAMADTLTASLTVDPSGQAAVATPPADPRYLLPLSGWYWQIDAAGSPVAKSASLADGQIRGVADPSRQATGPDDQPLRLVVRDVTLPELGPLRIVVATARDNVVAAQSVIRRPLARALGLLGLGLGLAMWAQLRWGLSSLDRLGRDIRAVREGRADALPPAQMAELRPAVDEMNALITQNRAVTSRAREHLGNLAHSLKTPLAALGNAIAPDHPGQALITRIDRQIGWHLRRARAPASGRQRLGARVPVAEVVDDILMVLRRPVADRGLRVTTDLAPQSGFAGERPELQEMLGNLIENAVKWAASRLIVTARTEAATTGAQLVLTVEDDGPGMAESDYAHALSRGVRLDETGPAGFGLGLAIVADLARLHGGSLTLRRADAGGLRAVLILPG